jgi:hypothetical protein
MDAFLKSGRLGTGQASLRETIMSVFLKPYLLVLNFLCYHFSQGHKLGVSQYLIYNIPSSQYYITNTCPRRKIRLKEGNAKCRHLKKLTCEGTWRCLSCLSVRGAEPNTHREGGRGGRIEPERRLEAQQCTKLGQNYKHD